LGDQDAPDALAAAAAQDAKIIQAGAVAVAPGQLLGIDRSLDRSPLMPLNHGLTAAQKRRCSGTPGPDVLRMARDVATIFDKLKALADRHAALHADQARLQAELDQARTELARARRPWWRRLMSR